MCPTFIFSFLLILVCLCQQFLVFFPHFLSVFILYFSNRLSQVLYHYFHSWWMIYLFGDKRQWFFVYYFVSLSCIMTKEHFLMDFYMFYDEIRNGRLFWCKILGLVNRECWFFKKMFIIRKSHWYWERDSFILCAKNFKRFIFVIEFFSSSLFKFQEILCFWGYCSTASTAILYE